jgi:fermentation-respiration switch protein FrsA (DUF1100 family)
MKVLYVSGAILLAVYAAICAFLYFEQDTLMYPPVLESNPPGATAFRLKRSNATLKIWELHPGAQRALIYFGGNGEDVAMNIADFDAWFPERAIYLVNYRGYSGSTGKPSEPALVEDAAAVFDWVKARHEGIAVMGRSLGTGVATALAAQRQVDWLVLVTPYDSVLNVAAGHYPWIPVRWLLKDRFDSVARIGRVHADVLALVAEQDNSILRARSDALIAAIAPERRHAVVIPRANHNDISFFPEYQAALKAFVAGR